MHSDSSAPHRFPVLPSLLSIASSLTTSLMTSWLICVTMFAIGLLASNISRLYNSSGVSHSDGSCVLGRIHSDVSSNIPKKVYHILTDNFVNLLHISCAWLYKTECWGRKFHAFSFNSHRNCKIFMTNFNFIFDTICIPYIFRKFIFGWNCDHDTPLCDTPLLEDTPLCDTADEFDGSGVWLDCSCLPVSFCWCWWSGIALKGTNGRQKTYEIFYVYCIFYSGFMCPTTVIFGITKDGSLESNNLASWNCFTCRNLF